MMSKRNLLIALALVALLSVGSGGYVLAKESASPAIDVTATDQSGTDLFPECPTNMPEDAADIEEWHQSPEHQQLHQEMMAQHPEMNEMHQQMMGNGTDFQAMHTQHHSL